MAGRHPLKGAGECVDQGLVPVDLGTRSMTQSCVPCVCVRCTTAGAPRCKNSSIPRTRRPADTNSDAGMTLDESTGLSLNKAVAPGPDWLLCRAFAKKTLVSFSPFWSPVPRGGVVSGSCSRYATYIPVVPYPIYQIPQSVLSFAGAYDFGVMCWQHLSNRLP